MIIGISGKRGVGKTTLAGWLSQQYGFVKISFADYLRHLAIDHLWGPKFKTAAKETPFGRYEWTPRRFMIDLGDLMRKYDPDYWVKQTMNRIDLQNGGKVFVIDDVRFPNEYKAVRDRNGLLIRLERKDELNIYPQKLDTPSETALDKHIFDHTIGEDDNTSLINLTNAGDKIARIMDYAR